MNRYTGNGEIDIASVVVYENHRSHYRNGKIQDTLLKLAPGNGGRIIKESGDHTEDNDQVIKYVFKGQLPEKEGNKHEYKYENYTRSSGLADGFGSVNGKFPATIRRKLLLENPEPYKSK